MDYANSNNITNKQFKHVSVFQRNGSSKKCFNRKKQFVEIDAGRIIQNGLNYNNCLKNVIKFNVRVLRRCYIFFKYITIYRHIVLYCTYLIKHYEHIYIYNVSECDDSIRYTAPSDQIDTGKITLTYRRA